jgi:TPR repeat protein
MFAIACCARDGIGMEPSAATSYRWFSAAAHLGLPAAQYSLGRCFELGFGCAADALKAVKWYELAAGGGDAQAMGALGNLHAVGAGELSMDKDAAARWWARAAAKGLAPAQFNLARAFEQGYKPKEDSGLAAKPLDGAPEALLLRSIQLYEAAAEQGLAEARVKLKELAPKTRGVRIDLGQDHYNPEDTIL